MKEFRYWTARTIAFVLSSLLAFNPPNVTGYQLNSIFSLKAEAFSDNQKRNQKKWDLLLSKISEVLNSYQSINEAIRKNKNLFSTSEYLHFLSIATRYPKMKIRSKVKFGSLYFSFGKKKHKLQIVGLQDRIFKIDGKKLQFSDKDMINKNFRLIQKELAQMNISEGIFSFGESSHAFVPLAAAISILVVIMVVLAYLNRGFANWLEITFSPITNVFKTAYDFIPTARYNLRIGYAKKIRDYISDRVTEVRSMSYSDSELEELVQNLTLEEANKQLRKRGKAEIASSKELENIKKEFFKRISNSSMAGVRK